MSELARRDTEVLLAVTQQELYGIDNAVDVGRTAIGLEQLALEIHERFKRDVLNRKITYDSDEGFDQLDAKLVGALFGNVGNLVVFRVGMKDAAVLERELFPIFQKEDLVSLPHYRAYVRLVIDGKPSRPFSAKVMAP